MIIWGSEGREKTLSEGTFFCPDCRADFPYQLKQLGQYFTLYFIPLFQTKDHGLFVECMVCGNKYKEDVLLSKPQKLEIPMAHGDEDRQFSTASELVRNHMMVTTMLYQDEILEMTFEQGQRYLAFELGVAEYYERAFLNLYETESMDAKFINFLIYHSHHTYVNNSEQVSRFWQKLAGNGLMYAERKLGFDSVKCKTNPDGTQRDGAYPGRYFKEAVGINITE